ncbi:ribbon-helix-helix protein, CopG family [Microseira wollei]|uniref:ribbon-helix-helix protein, CopG family n=1 Tax=Microseira wollei TaxID=467598 RepID=UPI001CFCDFED|nr:ribbon-helix-helix protein, CopG family [Microseira wollei]
MNKRENVVNFRITSEEKRILQEYCNETGRNQTEVFREFIRSLDQKLSKKRASNPLF